MSADDGYEYKILRSGWTTFRNPARLRSILEYEAESGWDLFEKLDDQRLRLRRPITCRQEDALRPHDAYRIWVGPAENAAAAIIVLAIFAAIAIMLGIMAMVMH